MPTIETILNPGGINPALTSNLEAAAVIFVVLLCAVCIIAVLEHLGLVVPRKRKNGGDHEAS